MEIGLQQEAQNHEYSYGIKKRASNSCAVIPPVGKTLSDSDASSMLQTLKADGLHAFKKGNHIYVIDASCGTDISGLISRIESLLPKKESATQMRKRLAAEKREAKKREFAAQRRRVIDNSQTIKDWIIDNLGEMNEFNMSAMIEYLGGSKSKFEGMVNRAVGAKLVHLGCTDGSLYDFVKLKAFFDASYR